MLVSNLIPYLPCGYGQGYCAYGYRSGLGARWAGWERTGGAAANHRRGGGWDGWDGWGCGAHEMAVQTGRWAAVGQDPVAVRQAGRQEGGESVLVMLGVLVAQHRRPTRLR